MCTHIYICFSSSFRPEGGNDVLLISSLNQFEIEQKRKKRKTGTLSLSVPRTLKEHGVVNLPGTGKWRTENHLLKGSSFRESIPKRRVDERLRFNGKVM
ncbi:hypothetical protein CEXT_295131 [Caerostris extrusa]|uniref:Uncharacterized protein n=1 Tax=Caerostris extrusa TaxID=172846 RepID=A0AAV4XH67_CAEEX|nr:hypothetical protein CEXT_295131 [Caerostris extrusa]